ncbi:hypothetical protein SCA6_000981 [Theobroma cacao]
MLMVAVHYLNSNRSGELLLRPKHPNSKNENFNLNVVRWWEEYASRIEKLLSSIMEKNGLIASYWNLQIVLSSWKLQRLVPAIRANKLVWKDTKMGMSLLIQVGIAFVAATLNACYNPAY